MSLKRVLHEKRASDLLKKKLEIRPTKAFSTFYVETNFGEL